MASPGTGALRRMAPFLAILGLLGAGGLTTLALSGDDESPAVSSDLVTIQLEGDPAAAPEPDSAAAPAAPGPGEAENSAAPAEERGQAEPASPEADRAPAAADHAAPEGDNPLKAATKLSRSAVEARPQSGGGQATSAPEPPAPAPAPQNPAPVAPAPAPAPQPPLNYQPYDDDWDDDWDEDDWDDDWDDDDWDDD